MLENLHLDKTFREVYWYNNQWAITDVSDASWRWNN